jgi:regulator of sigma E protease
MVFFPILLLTILNIIYVVGFLAAVVLRKSTEGEHYFLGFNPRLLLFRCRKVKFTLGIYIPIIGLARIYSVDEAGKKQLFYPWQLAHASVTQRLLLTYSGVASLFVFGVLMSILSVYTSSEQYIPKEEVIKHGIYPSPQARTVGFLPGDKVIAVNGKDYNDFAELLARETSDTPQTSYTILRDGRQLILSLAKVSGQSVPTDQLFLSVNAPFSIGGVVPGSPAQNAGLLPRDRVNKINGYPITSFQEMNAYLESDEDGEITLEIQRADNSQPTFERTLVLNEYRKIGIWVQQEIEYQTKMYSFAESAKLGTVRFGSDVIRQFKSFGGIMGPGQGEKKVSGPIGISGAFGTTFSFSRFASLTSMYITFIIALNFLPLPKSAMLEVIPLAYEAVKRKSLAYKSFRRIRQISIGLLALMIVWQMVSDIMMLF